MPTPLPSMCRRSLLRGLAASGLLAALAAPVPAAGRPAGSRRAALLRHLDSLVRPSGGYAWYPNARAHLTPTHAAIGARRLLGEAVPGAAALARWVRANHPRELKKLEQERRAFDYQQVQSLVWLGDPAADFAERLGGWTRPLDYLKQYEKNGYPVFRSELAAVLCRVLLGLPLGPLSPAYPDYLVSRRHPDGSFNNTPASEGGDGHVVNTLWGLRASLALGLQQPPREPLVAWLRACQRPAGGFTHAPQPAIGGVEDVAYTAAAVRALKLLGAAPADRAGCIAWVLSLANADGGFGDRPGWLSNPVAAHAALETLDALDALGTLDAPIPTPAATPTAASAPIPDAPARTSPPGGAGARAGLHPGLRVFSLQLEAHGRGSPAEAVALAGALRIDLWGAKNATPAWRARAQALADRRGVPVRFFAANEEYGTWVHVPGLGTYSHMSDIVAPPGVDPEGSLANQGVVSWQAFRERRLVPLHAAQGRLVWQFGENEELVRLLLDDSVERGGFAALSTFHFGNPDFTNTEPFLQRWRGRIPFVALQDAHGEEPWWFADQTAGFRTLFLAEAPTWEGWLRALERNWVVAVRHDEVSGGATWLHSGSEAVADFVRRREAEWRWWDNPRVRRPLVSLEALSPSDLFEAGKPDAGLALRVRWAWKNTAQGMPQTPLAAFVGLSVDGVPVETTLVERRRPRGGAGLADCYRLHALPVPPPGRHTAVATVRVLADGSEVSQRVDFGA